MRLTTFASGSGGNCALVEGRGANVLLDAGISLRRIRTALSARGLGMEDVAGVFITHEHADHVAGLKTMLKYYDIPVYAPPTVGRRLCGALPALEDSLTVIRPGEPAAIGALTVTAFRTSHDTDESVGYRLEDDRTSFGLCTDTGVITEGIMEALRGCGAALIEANHDEEMLRFGPYPVPLKRRILSERGHLSNAASARLACFLAENGTESIVLGHLSRENNTPRKAMEAVRTALDSRGFGNVRLYAALQDEELSLEITPCCASN